MPNQPSTTWLVSCKGVVLAGDAVLLAANDRDEWELPGGRLERGETPGRCVTREIAEETGLGVEVEGIIDSWVYEPIPGHQVLIVTYGCRDLAIVPEVGASDEHRDVAFLPLDRLDGLALPNGYRTSIQSWATRPRGL